MFKKILLPCDGSRCSVEAARVAAELAAAHGAVVTPVVAVEYQYIHADDMPEDVAAAIKERIRARSEKALQLAAAVLREGNARAEDGKVLEGAPSDAIVREAEDGEYDLIVIGSRGVNFDNGYQRLMGSVTERVLHATPCPVMVIRAEPRP